MKKRKISSKKIYCFGNPDIKEDRAPLDLADSLNDDKDVEEAGFEFVKCTSPDFLINLDKREIIVMDAVKGLKDVQMITEMDVLAEKKTTTMHDFDLGMVIKLMKKADPKRRFRIIGLPYHTKGKSRRYVVQGIKSILRKLL